MRFFIIPSIHLVSYDSNSAPYYLILPLYLNLIDYIFEETQCPQFGNNTFLSPLLL